MNTPDYVKALPKLPGIYVFKNKHNEVIYIGKAKELKVRVSSYFNKTTDWKVRELIKEHASVEHIITKNELEALLLEAQMIRTYKPKYNVLMKNSNPFVYLVITNTPLPRLELVRLKKGKGTFFGPFLYKKRARSSYDYLMRNLRLGLCKMNVEQGCLDYHMGLCAGSCRSDFDKKEYLVRMSIAQKLLEGNYEECEALLIQQIKEHNARLEFEKSKRLSEHLDDLASLFASLKTGFSERKYAEDMNIVISSIKKRVERPQQALEELGTLLQLSEKPVTIDCFDISHFQGSHIVGSCIRFTNGVPDRNKFRRFKIKTLTEQNDYAALQEIVSRRYRNIKDAPDIILIDGGKGQLSSVKKLFPELLCVSLAKREERLHTPEYPEGVPLDVHTPMGQLLICLRDYAHHFAVSYHKVLRSKKFIS